MSVVPRASGALLVADEIVSSLSLSPCRKFPAAPTRTIPTNRTSSTPPLTALLPPP
jgi:hypothetical protein